MLLCNLHSTYITKDGLISEIFFHFGSNLKKRYDGSDLVPFFGNLSQSEKLSEIKPPLVV